MRGLWRASVAVSGVAAACGVALLARVLERYNDSGTVDWGALFKALMVPTLTFWIARFGERRMVGGQPAAASVAAQGQRQPDAR
jgi:hypothetical protein